MKRPFPLHVTWAIVFLCTYSNFILFFLKERNQLSWFYTKEPWNSNKKISPPIQSKEDEAIIENQTEPKNLRSRCHCHEGLPSFLVTPMGLATTTRQCCENFLTAEVT